MEHLDNLVEGITEYPANGWDTDSGNIQDEKLLAYFLGDEYMFFNLFGSRAKKNLKKQFKTKYGKNWRPYWQAYRKEVLKKEYGNSWRKFIKEEASADPDLAEADTLPEETDKSLIVPEADLKSMEKSAETEEGFMSKMPVIIGGSVLFLGIMATVLIVVLKQKKA